MCSYYTDHELNLIFVLSMVIFLTLCNLTMETISKYSLCYRWLKIVFENFECSWDIQTSKILLLCFLHVFWVHLLLDNYLIVLPRDLPWGRMFINGKVCGRIWYLSCHLQWFWSSPLNKWRILKSWQNVLKRYASVLAEPEICSSLLSAGVWPSHIKQYSTLFGTFEKMALDLIQLWWQALQLN